MATSKTGLSVEEIVSRMTSMDSLDGWGVLVAYNENSLDKLLEARHNALPENMTKIPSLEVPVPDSTDPSLKIKYRDLTLQTPVLKLKASSGLVQLLFSLGGYYTEPGQPESMFEDGLFLEAEGRLVNVAGQSGSVSLFGTVQSLENSGESKCDVAIDLTSPLVQILDKDKNPVFSLGNVATTLTNQISSIGLQYRLATVQKDTAGVATKAGSQIILKPTKFVMTTVESNDSAPGALLVWMAVEGIQSTGRIPSESSPLIFSRQGDNDITNASPISKDSTASIVISREVFTSLFIEPQLKQLGYTGIGFFENTGDTKTGITFKANPPSKTVQMDEINQGDWGLRDGKDHVDAISFDLNSAPAVFFLDKNSPSITLKYEKRDVGYYHEYTLMVGIMVGTPTRKSGQAVFTFSADGKGTWKSNGNEQFGISFELPANFKVDANPESKGLLAKIVGAMDAKIKAMDNLSIAVPPFSLDLGAIDFFLTTNLLLPGQHIFKLRAVPDNLYFPRDILLQGDV